MLGRVTHRYHRGSVLPKIAATRTPDGGAQLFAARASTRDVLIGILAGLGGVFSLWAAIYGELDLGRAIQSAMSAVIGLGAFFHLMKSYRQRRRLHHAALWVRPWPLRLGDSASAELHVVVEGNAPDVAASVQCMEHITYSQGKYSRTQSTSLFSMMLPAQHEWSFTLPAKYPPSLQVESNEVRWHLSTVVRDGDVEIPVSFELLVIPEVVA